MSKPKPWLRIALALVLLAGGALAIIYRRELHLFEIQDWLDDFGPFGPLAFIVANVLASLFFVPRTLMAIVAGVLFGLWWGSLWALIGSLVGAFAGFYAARYLNADSLRLEDMKRFGPLLKRAEAGGWRMVAIARLIPVLPHTPTNYALGLTRLSAWSYFIGSLVGLLPSTIIYANIGATGRYAASGGADWIEPALWGGAFVLASIVLPKILRRWSKP